MQMHMHWSVVVEFHNADAASRLSSSFFLSLGFSSTGRIYNFFGFLQANPQPLLIKNVSVADSRDSTAGDSNRDPQLQDVRRLFLWSSDKKCHDESNSEIPMSHRFAVCCSLRVFFRKKNRSDKNSYLNYFTVLCCHILHFKFNFSLYYYSISAFTALLSTTPDHELTVCFINENRCVAIFPQYCALLAALCCVLHYTQWGLSLHSPKPWYLLPTPESMASSTALT